MRDAFIHHPFEFIAAVLRGTPNWVWGLLAALVILGFTMARDRQARLPRLVIMPVAMTGMAFWSLGTALGASGMYPALTMIWFASAAFVTAVVASLEPPAGARYDGDTATFAIPGSWLPLSLILGVFLVRYTINVALAIDRSLPQDALFALTVAALYGMFSGLFLGRTLRVLKLALPAHGMRGLLQRDPW